MTTPPKRRLAPIVVKSVGEPMEFSGLARLILRALAELPSSKLLTESDEQSSRCVSEVEQRP